jgi:serine phosphatase RsbU (regulator of sigma subunit)
MLLLYSDGLTDAVNASNECFGIAQLHHRLPGMHAEPAQTVCADLNRMVADHQGGVARFDDVTLVVIQNRRSHRP